MACHFPMIKYVSSNHRCFNARATGDVDFFTYDIDVCMRIYVDSLSDLLSLEFARSINP